MKSKFRNSRLFWFIKNICVFWRCDLYKEIEELKSKQKKIEQVTYPACYINKIFNYCIANPETFHLFEKELQFLANNPSNIIFPYKHIKTLANFDVEYDNCKQMFYVIHNDKKLYFPSRFTKDEVSFIYRNYIETENILGGNYCEKSPHQYESEYCKVEEGDVLLDIGCAEALFALHHIDKLKEVYLIESDNLWINALEATFEPYKGKIHIINKLIDLDNTNDSITLHEILSNINENDTIFIKMDIESAEKKVLQSSIHYLKDRKVKIACCTYHKPDDFDVIKNILDNNGFEQDCSDGYMLIYYDEDFIPPYFRHGILRAKSILLKTTNNLI